MKIIKVSNNKYIKVKDEVETLILEEINNIYNILKSISDGENSHNHDTIYYLKNEVDLLLKGYSTTNHLHNNTYYTKEEVVNIVNQAIAQNPYNDEIHVSELAPQNNEKLWFRITT